MRPGPKGSGTMCPCDVACKIVRLVAPPTLAVLLHAVLGRILPRILRIYTKSASVEARGKEREIPAYDFK